MGQRERILRDGAIPAKYKHLMKFYLFQCLPDTIDPRGPKGGR